MNTYNIEKMKHLIRGAKCLEEFWPEFDKRTLDNKVDKYGAGFNLDKRFSSFSCSISFDSWIGTYGDSGCGKVLALHNQYHQYLPFAMNRFKREIFEEMAKLMRKDAEKYRNAAEAELAQITGMLEISQRELEARSTGPLGNSDPAG